MTNSNTQILNKFYEYFLSGDLNGMLTLCSDDVTFQVPGKSMLAGKYTKHTLGSGLLEKIASLSSGTFKMELHDIMASDIHGMVLSTNRVTRGDIKHEYRSVHVWRIQGGKLVAWYEYPRDLYQYDLVWS